MADDIDDLLDEVETKYAGRAKNVSGGSSRPKPKVRNKLDEDINDILTDVHLDDELHPSRPSRSVQDPKTTQAVAASGQKCYAVYIGGSQHPAGQATAISQRTCDQLRCTSCDFKVCQFDNYKWASDTNYLFLRNNVPEFSKLKAKLSAAKGQRAYCCQCCWRTFKDLAQLTDPELKWHCGKH